MQRRSPQESEEPMSVPGFKSNQWILSLVFLGLFLGLIISGVPVVRAETKPTLVIFPFIVEKVEEGLSHWGRKRFEENVVSSSIELGKEFKADFVLVGIIFRFEERVGSSLGVEKPASVAFDLHLFRMRDGKKVWDGGFDETRRPLG